MGEQGQDISRTTVPAPVAPPPSLCPRGPRAPDCHYALTLPLQPGSLQGAFTQQGQVPACTRAWPANLAGPAWLGPAGGAPWPSPAPLGGRLLPQARLPDMPPRGSPWPVAGGQHISPAISPWLWLTSHYHLWAGWDQRPQWPKDPGQVNAAVSVGGGSSQGKTPPYPHTHR